MDADNLLLLVRAKLADGRLPSDSIPRVWGGPGAGEICDVCEGIVSPLQMVMEGISESGRGMRMHVECFYLWDRERHAEGHAPSGPTGHPPGEEGAPPERQSPA